MAKRRSNGEGNIRKRRDGRWEGRYTAGQIDSVWSDEMNKAFVSWVRNYPGKLPMSEKQLEACLKERNF